MQKRAMLTQERLKEILDYDPETGVFTWKVSVGSRAKAGRVAGAVGTNGYREIRFNTRLYLAHRLAFLYMEGYIPEYEVDHINGMVDDNRWTNLRHVSHLCNLQNCKLRSNNISGFSNVSWRVRDKRFYASAVINGKYFYLGSYTDILDAALARLTFEVQCPLWTCNHRSGLVEAIKKAWPEFNEKCLS